MAAIWIAGESSVASFATRSAQEVLHAVQDGVLNEQTQHIAS